MEYGFESNIIERKAFLLMLAFGFASTGILVFQVGFQFYYFRSIASSAEFFVAFGVLINAYSFLVNPVLLFVAFYKVCGRNFSGKTASTLISLILGAVLGALLGWVVVGGVFALTTADSMASSLGMVWQGLQSNVTSNVLRALAAVAFATVVARWDEKLLGEGREWKVQRPFEVSIASAVYALSGILALCLSPFLLVLQYDTGPGYWELVAATVILVMIGGVIELYIGYGLYKGRRWGWLVAFAATLISLVFNAATLGLIASAESNLSSILMAQAVFAFLTLLLNLAVIGCLLLLKSRLYCRMVDPPASS